MVRSAWKVLSTTRANLDAPPILIKHEIGSANYAVWLTDLTSVWSEMLDRKQILRRSFDLETSIDPSEDADQFRLFLQRVGDALEQKPSTTLSLVGNGSEKGLHLRTLTPLPGALKSLDWLIKLMPAPQPDLTAELVVPLLRQRVIANMEKVSLLQQIKEKDQVIAKLMDKLQSDGVDLSRLFPGVGSKMGKSTSRQALGKSVKGLTEFDEEKWRKHVLSTGAPFDGLVEVVSDAFEIELFDQPEMAPMPQYEKWWEKVGHEQFRRESLPRIRSEFEGDTSTQDEFQAGHSRRVAFNLHCSSRLHRDRQHLSKRVIP